MEIHVWGTDFRRTQSSHRAKIFFPVEQREPRLRELLALGFGDLFYLHTCNRVEFYTTVTDPFQDTRKLWKQALGQITGDPDTFYQGYYLEGKSALRHLLRVSCSLESFVIGESQILGQLKEVHQWTKDAGLPLGRTLERSLTLAYQTAKKVRAETTLGERSVSVAGLAVRYLQRLEKESPLRKMVLVGRSPIVLWILRWILKNRPGCELLWVNRTLATLEGYEESRQVPLMSLDSFLDRPSEFSHLVTATSSAEPIFDNRFFRKLKEENRVVLDLAEPPDVCAEGLDEVVHLYRLESFVEEAKANEGLRTCEIEKAEELIGKALGEYYLETKETPVLKEFSAVGAVFQRLFEERWEDLEDTLPETLQESIKVWGQKLVNQNLHFSKEHLRAVLRETAFSKPDVSDPP